MTPPPAAAATVRSGRGALADRPRARVAPRPPRRVSGPARSPARGHAARHRDRPVGGLALRALAVARAAWEHRLLDRALRGRAWIALVTCALLGIVSLQLALLALNGSIGRALERKAQLLREDTALSIEISSLASDEHVLGGAAQAGMVAVPLTSMRFLDARREHLGMAVAALRAPASSPSRASSSSSTGSQPQVTSTESSAPAASSAGREAESTGAGTTTGESVSSASGSATGSTGASGATPPTTGATSPTGEVQSPGAGGGGGAPASGG